MAKSKVFVPHGMLFLYGRHAKGITLPEYEPSKIVKSTSNAISIAAQSDVDGEVEVELLPASQLRYDEKVEIFRGKIWIEGNCLSVCTMGDEEIMSILTPSGHIEVIITSNVSHFPDIISIYVEGAESRTS